MRKLASIVAVVVGLLMVVAGGVTWVVVSQTLADQKITVAEDADCMAGATVNGPYAAYCQAQVINKHTLESTGGKTYAELDREDPLREVAMTSSFLQASLFTSVVAFGVAAMAVGVGLVLTLIGFGMRDVARAPASAPRSTAPVA